MQIVPLEAEAYQLLHEGMIALSDMQLNGVRIDVDYCKQAYRDLSQRIKEQEKQLESHEEIKTWKKIYKDKFSLDSGDQLKDILFDKFQHEPVAFTDKGNPSVDKEALQALGLSFTDDLLNYRKLTKARSTYIRPLIKETHAGFLHAFLNLHTTLTYRSSSNDPNLQNIPIRDPEVGGFVRPAFIPRDGCYLIECDYGGVEVKGSSWYHKDPTMLEYLRNLETSDMHADFMSQLFKLDTYDLKNKGDKQLRKGTKNAFTFPQFYGDYYGNNAISLWNWAELKGKKVSAKHGLKLSNGKTVGQHLIDVGIRNFKQFEKHVQKVEKHMWYDSFPVYRQWKEDTYAWYTKHGYLTSLSGFTFQGVMQRNNAVNYPIQCVCFHCLLWSIIRISKLLKKHKMKTKLISQIHDSIIADVPKRERKDYLEILKQVMCHEIKDHWKFIITPLELEAETSELNGNWHKMSPILKYAF